MDRKTLDGTRFHFAIKLNANMLRLVLATALLISVSLSCTREPDIVKLGTEGAYPPYNFINDDGEVDGFERELGDEPMPTGPSRMHLGHR